MQSLNPSLQEVLSLFPEESQIRYDTGAIQRALAETGSPHKDVKTLVIGGTNGKGSVSLFVSAGLIEAGFKIGTYLSPHLYNPEERFLSQLKIEEEQLGQLGQELLPTAQRFKLTYFEYLTLIAFHWAKQSAFDFLVLEVGLGGRLDATNVTDPLACAITSIGLDHTEYLGNTEESILKEKLGIIKNETLVFSGITQPHLKGLLEKHCDELDAIYYHASEIHSEVKSRSWDAQEITLNGYPFTLKNPTESNARNAALAFLFLRIVFPKFDVDVWQRAFKKVCNPGRFEVMQTNPRVIISGDHNLAGIQGLVETLKEMGEEKVSFLCGFSPKKDHAAMWQALKPVASSQILTTISKFQDRMPAEYTNLGNYIANPEKALRTALEKTPSDQLLVITGSLYLVGELRKFWKPEVEFLESDSIIGPLF